MKKCPICDGNNNHSAKRCEYCDYVFTTEMEVHSDSANKTDLDKYDAATDFSNINASANIKKNKIDAYFEDEGAENKVILAPNISAKPNGQSNSVVPILVVVIILLAIISTILFLLYFRNIDNNPNGTANNVSNADFTSTVVSEIKTIENEPVNPATPEVQNTEINEGYENLNIIESNQIIEEISEEFENLRNTLTKNDIYNRYIEIINSMDFPPPYRGFLVDLNDDNINELIVPDVEDMTYKLYYYDGTDVKSIEFGRFMALSNFVLYKVEGDNGENYIYYRDNYGYKSEQGYFSLDNAAEINIFLKFPDDEGIASWNINYNKIELFAEGSEYVSGLYGETKQCYAQILAAFQKYGFSISDNSNYNSINGLYYGELTGELRGYN